jgi:WhiB family transcriptional regulator, redox-sensing transcriptional regulator
MSMRRRDDRPRPIVEDWDWQSRGNCLRWPTEVFFPEDQGRPGLRARQQRAMQICRNCPVLNECREHALAAPEVHGIWGATTPRQRAHLLADSETPAPRESSA